MNDELSNPTEAFVGLFAQNQYEIHSFILTLVPNWADADDVMQATSIVLWRKFSQFRPGTNFVAWACQTARLEIHNFRRVKGRDRLFFDDSLLQSLGDVRLSMGDELEAERQFLNECIARLKTDDHELIRRCYKPATIRRIARSRRCSVRRRHRRPTLRAAPSHAGRQHRRAAVLRPLCRHPRRTAPIECRGGNGRASTVCRPAHHRRSFAADPLATEPSFSGRFCVLVRAIGPDSSDGGAGRLDVEAPLRSARSTLCPRPTRCNGWA